MLLFGFNQLCKRVVPRAFRPAEVFSEKCIGGVSKYLFETTLLQLEVDIATVLCAHVAVVMAAPDMKLGTAFGAMYMRGMAEPLVVAGVCILGAGRVAYALYRGRLCVFNVK